MHRLRSRNANLPAAAGAAKPNVDPPAKRAASKQASAGKADDAASRGEPKAKQSRAVLGDLTTKLSAGLVIDSALGRSKGLGGKNAQNGAAAAVPARRTRSQKGEENAEKLAPLAKIDFGDENDDVIVIEQAVEKKAFDPCPDYDYDAENAGNDFEVPVFAHEIFAYHRDREAVYKVGDYLKKQPKLSRESRAILVDWMIEVQETFELNHETLYLGVKLLDTYLHSTNKAVDPSELQLVASAAVWLASKYEERSPPLIDDFIYMSEDSFARQALEERERELFTAVGFDLGAPLGYSHLRRYAKTCKVDMQCLTLARFILETSLMFYEFVGASESKMAAGAFLLALKMKDATAEWTPAMHKYSGYGAAEVEPWVWALNHMLHIRKSGRGVYADQHTVTDKYSHEIFFQSALVEPLADKFPLKQAIVCPK